MLVVLGLVTAWDGTLALAGPGALDGKVFAGRIGRKGRAKGDKDELRFANGKFRSTACDPYGFGDGAYTASAQGDTVTFEAQTTSPTDGTMRWKGMVRAKTLEGTATWSKPGKKAPEEYWFKATRKD